MRPWIPTLTIVIAASASTFGQDASVWIGHKVVTIAPTPLRIENRVVNDDSIFRVYQVEHAKDGWLWLVGDVRGWVPASRVVQYQQAIPYYDQILRNDPGATWALSRRAALWRERKEFKNAEADYAEYIRQRPDDPSGYVGRGRILLDQGAYPDAMSDFSQAIQIDPNDPLAYMERGSARLLVQSYNSAIADFTTVIKLSPGDIMAYCLRSVAYFNLHKLDNALADSNEAVRLDPTFERGNPFEVRGMAKMAKGDLSGALVDFSQSIRLNPTKCNLYSLRAMVQFMLRDLDAALSDCNEAIRLDPTGLNGEVYGTRASVYFALKDYVNALSDCDQSILYGSTNPRLSILYINRGNIRDHGKDYDGAVADLNEAIRLDPKSAFAYRCRGSVHRLHSNYEMALDDYEMAFKIAPNNPDVLRSKSWFHSACPDAKFRDGPLAVALATRALELSQRKGSDYLDVLAVAYAEFGDFDKAIEWQQKALDQSTPNDDKDALEGRLALFRHHVPFRDTEDVWHK